MKKLLLVLPVLLILGACTKPTTTAKVEETAVNSVPQTQAPAPAPVQTAPAQPTGDPIKDEMLWPIGKFGYHEPPEDLRTPYVDPITHKTSTNKYRISIHDDRYGDLELQYNTSTGQRTVFKAGTENDKLMIISEDHPISIAEALEDLRIGDNVARNFGK